MVLEEQPHKVCEAMRLFLQGLGYGKCLIILKKKMEGAIVQYLMNDRSILFD